MTMKNPTALVTAALMAAILLAASFLIAAETRGEEALVPQFRSSYNSGEPGLRTSESLPLVVQGLQIGGTGK
jgi:hypothetical protein